MSNDDEETRSVGVHKVTMVFVDHDNIGLDGIINAIECHKYLCPIVETSESTSVEWSDEHPLNNRNTCIEAVKQLFPKR